MIPVRITAIRKANYSDLQQLYENPIEQACDVCEGMAWISYEAKRPDNFCPEAWKTIQGFVDVLANGGGNFFNGWMRNPKSALLSCNDGFRPVSFLLEALL